MKLHRIYGMVLRNLLGFKHNLNRLTDMFYWPTLDLLLWGITTTYMQSLAPDANQIVMMIVSGILLWIIIWRGQYEITVSLLNELWDRNLINIFVTPLRFSEFIISFIILGLIKGFMSFGFASLVAFFLYKVGIFTYGWYLIPFILLLIMNGWWVGFLIAGIIMRFGTRVEALAWITIYVISPFAAIYYPLSVLPGWAQIIAKLIPASYIFEGAREVLHTGTLDPQKIVICFVLNIVYLCLAIIFLKKSFNKILSKGLVKVY